MTADEPLERIRQQGMRDHPFVGDGIHCKKWSAPHTVGGIDGEFTFSSVCGYPRDMHPEDWPDVLGELQDGLKEDGNWK